jgi:hypothetical protein
VSQAYRDIPDKAAIFPGCLADLSPFRVSVLTRILGERPETSLVPSQPELRLGVAVGCPRKPTAEHASEIRRQ